MRLATLAILAFVGTACGDSFDYEYDCNQGKRCCDELNQPVGAIAVSACKSDAETYFSTISPSAGNNLEAAFASCANQTGCGYVSCMRGADQCILGTWR